MLSACVIAGSKTSFRCCGVRGDAMGITIFARGSIDNIDHIPSLIAEMRELSEKNGWKHKIIDDDFEEEPKVGLGRDEEASCTKITGSLGLKGILMNVGYGVETLALLFDRSGVLTDVMSQVTWLENKSMDERVSMCKTQFGTIEAHISIIELLDILKKKYMTDLEVMDEGDYWTSRDRDLLAEKRAVLEHYINHAAEVISQTQKPADASAEALGSSIEKALLDAEDKEGPIQ
jgi:hypothetical protein